VGDGSESFGLEKARTNLVGLVRGRSIQVHYGEASAAVLHFGVLALPEPEMMVAREKGHGFELA